MPRENSFSDSEGRSLTPDLDDDELICPLSPIQPGTGSTSPVTAPLHSTTPAVPLSLDSSAITSNTNATAVAVDPKLPAQTTSPKISLLMENPPSLDVTLSGTVTRRWRSIVKKVLHLHRASTALSRRGAGAEPGVDPRRESAFITYGHIKQNCIIQIADYSSVRNSFGQMTNREFVNFLKDPKASERESWVKVRWINIGGISYDVLSQLALTYNIHPLALEDVLHQHSRARSKADYYLQHLFIRALCHSLGPDEDDSDVSVNLTELVRSTSPMPFLEDGTAFKMHSISDKERPEFGSKSGSKISLRRGRKRENETSGRFRFGKVDLESPAQSKTPSKLASFMSGYDRAANLKTIEELKKGQRVNVKTNLMSIFLFRDGTVITVSPEQNVDFTAPITARLKQRDTGLRASADPSLLVQSVLDLIVDKVLEVVDAYHTKILELEHKVLIKPDVKTVRYLHILSGDLTLHRRLLEPIKTMIYALRRYDIDRVAALMDQTPSPGVVMEGFMSHKAKIYLADVYDHMEYALSSLEMFSNIAENLISYSFNLASYDMNEVMRRLTLATIIFLPLTLLTGYFGMNFEPEWSVNQHSDLFFWVVALPVMAVIMPIFLRQDVIKMVHYVKKRMLAHRVTETFAAASHKRRR